MRYFQISIFFTVAYFAFACTSAKQDDGDLSSGECEIRKMPTKTTAFVDSVDFINLEECEGNQFSAVSKILCDDDHVYLFDRLGSGLVIAYDHSGKFCFNVGARGRAQNEYVKAWDFDVTDESVIVYDRVGKKLVWYDKSGVFQRMGSLSCILQGFKAVSGDRIIAAMAMNDERRELCILDSALNICETLLSFHERKTKDDKVTDFILQETRGALLYNRPISNTIYEFSKDGQLRHTYNFDFWGNNAPSELAASYASFVQEGGKKKYVYMPDCPFRIGGTFVGVISIEGRRGTFAYNVESKDCRFDEWCDKATLSNIILPVGVHGNCIYGWIDSSVLSIMENSDGLPESSVKHVQNGGKVLIRYHCMGL